MNGTSKLRIGLRVVGIVAVLVLGALLVLRWQWRRDLVRAEADFRARLGPTDLASYVSPTVTDDQNAAIWLRAGARALVFMGDDRAKLGEMTLREVASWTPEQRRRLDEFLTRSQPALTLVQRAVGLERSSFGITFEDLTANEFRDRLPLLDLLWVARLFNMQARMALAAGNEAEFMAATAPMPVLATALERESPLIAGLIGIASEKIFLDAVHVAVRDAGVSDETLARLERVLPTEDARGAWRRNTASEALAAAARLRQPKAEGGVGAHGIMAGLWEDYALPRSLRFYVALSELLDRPFGLDRNWLATEQQRVSDLGVWDFATPNLLNAAGRYQSLLALRKLARVALALRRGAIANGAYPASLAGISGATEPDAFSGKPLVYERRADGSARVAITDGDALWRRLVPGIPTSVPYSWELPALPQR